MANLGQDVTSTSGPPTTDTFQGRTPVQSTGVSLGLVGRENSVSNTFSFADVHAKAFLPFARGSPDLPYMVDLPGLSLVSLSEHIDPFPVVTMGRRGVKGFTRGHITTAGTLGFESQGGALNEIIAVYNAWLGFGRAVGITSPALLPPIDISLVLMSERADVGVAEIYISGIVFVDSGRTIGVDNIRLTETYSFLANYATPVTPINQTGPEILGALDSREDGTTGYSDLIPTDRTGAPMASPPIGEQDSSMKSRLLNSFGSGG